MDPVPGDLEKMSVLAHAYQWAGVRDDLRAAIEETMGKLVEFREVVLAPERVWSAAVQQLRIVTVMAVPEVLPSGTFGAAGFQAGSPPKAREDRPLNVLETAQVGMIRRISRLRLNEPADEAVGGGGSGGQGGGSGGQGPNSSSAPAPVTTKPAGGARLSEVIDQADHAEVEPWTPERVRAAMAVYKSGNRGMAPKEAYRPTGLQFAALEYKLRTANSIYVDLGVWRRNGGRLERKMRLTIHQRNHRGDWIPLEIAGPANFREWQHGWRLFIVAMRAMNEADQQELEAYQEMLEELVHTFGSEAWWICAQGDSRMRSERMPALLELALEEKVEADRKNQFHPLDVRRPWGYIFSLAVKDRNWWTDEVKDKAHRWLTRVETKDSITEDGFGPVRPGDSGLQGLQEAAVAVGSKKRKHSPAASSCSSSDEPPEKRKKQGGRGRRARGGAGKSAKPKAAPKGRVKPSLPSKRDPKGKGKGKASGELHRRTAAGKEICYKYSRDGTCTNPCPGGRAHVCEKCLRGGHKTADCP